MAFTEFHYYSETLEIDVSVNVILPETRVMAQQEGKPLPTLYLLHGLSDDHTHWVRQTRLEFYARKYRLAIIMPCVNRSFYTDMKRGAKYFTFVSEELPRVMEMYFPLSSRREDRFAAGLSMGGYGATKLGLRLPERYAAIASLSGALEMENDYHMRKMRDSDRLYQELLEHFWYGRGISGQRQLPDPAGGAAGPRQGSPDVRGLRHGGLPVWLQRGLHPPLRRKVLHPLHHRRGRGPHVGLLGSPDREGSGVAERA